MTALHNGHAFGKAFDGSCAFDPRMEGAMMKNIENLIPNAYAACKSLFIAVCAVLAIGACQDGPDRPIPPQAPPKPQAAAQATGTENVHPSLYDASNVQGAVFKYTSSSTLQYQNAQGKTVKRFVIRT
jgi:hypothetical protein